MDPRVLVIVAETEVDKITVVEEVVVVLRRVEVSRGCHCQCHGSEENCEALHRSINSLTCGEELHCEGESTLPWVSSGLWINHMQARDRINDRSGTYYV